MGESKENKLKAYETIRATIEADLEQERQRRLSSAREALGLNPEDLEAPSLFDSSITDFIHGPAVRMRKINKRGGQADRVKAALNVMPKQFKISDLMAEIAKQAPELASKRRSIATYVWKKATHKNGLKIADRGDGNEGNVYEKL